MTPDPRTREHPELTELAQAIYERSVTLADGSGLPDWLEDGDGGMWLPAETRGQAIAHYASEFGHAFTEARDGNYEANDIAYTWEDEGWMWERCDKNDERGVALWYCELATWTER